MTRTDPYGPFVADPYGPSLPNIPGSANYTVAPGAREEGCPSTLSTQVGPDMKTFTRSAGLRFGVGPLKTGPAAGFEWFDQCYMPMGA